MDKDLVDRLLDHAIASTHRQYFPFQGVVLFGSFLVKDDPDDVDIIPVLLTYDSSWDFKSPWEEEPVDDSAAYHEYLKIESFFANFFKNVPGYEVAVKTLRNRNGLLHIETLMALDDLKLVQRVMEEKETHYGNFRGTAYAQRVLETHFAKNQ